MRIAFLSTFYPFRGGIAQFNATLYRTFEKNHEVKAFNFSRQYPEMLFPGTSQLVTAKDIADKIPSEQILDTVNPYTYFTTAYRIGQWKPDLVITKFWMPFFAPPLGSVFYRLKKKTKIISILDNVIPHERRIGDISLAKFFLNQNHGFVVMSDAVKNDLLKLKPDANFIFHAHPLYNHFGDKENKTEARKKLGIPADKKVILFFGFIRDYKGLDVLLKAFAKLGNDYFLCIAGEVYGDFSKYQTLISENNLQNRVLVNTHYISDEFVPSYFSAADVCVLPYKSATQSGITSIAFHFELPVIATNVGGLSEYIDHNKTGIIVEKADETLIAEAIKNYFENNSHPNFSQEIAKQSQKYSWENMASEIEKFYHTL